MDTLPIRLPPLEMESGLSFLFRCLNANGFLLKEAQKWLGVRSWTPMAHTDLQLWAWATGVERDWLQECSVVAYRNRNEVRYGLQGHHFGVGGVTTNHSSRLCTECVGHGGSHRVSWQLTCVPWCAVHDQVLIDRCPHCHRVISWNRPALDICSCGHFLTRAERKQNPHPLLLQWVRWIETRLNRKDVLVKAGDFGLPDFLGVLSIDGAMRVTVAAGLLPDENASPSLPSKLSRTSDGMAQVIARGLKRLASLEGDFSNLHRLRPVLHLPAIERMRAKPITQADEIAAAILLGQLEYFPQGTTQMSVSPRLRQKVLF